MLDMHDTQIKAVLFDLGETLLDFGIIKPVEVFAAGAKSSYDYLKSLNQPVGGFKSYFWTNLLNLRMQRWISWFKRRDFDALALLKSVGTKKGLTLSAEQWQYMAWLWYEPLSKIGATEPQTKETLAALKDYGLCARHVTRKTPRTIGHTGFLYGQTLFV
jgi:FMN phosphatase YigB (HAD superfamily)